jgi:hypothetical protein
VHYSSLKSNSWAYHIMTYQYFSIFLNMKHNIDRLSYEFSYWQTVYLNMIKSYKIIIINIYVRDISTNN